MDQSNTYAKFRTFSTKEGTTALKELLEENDIEVQLGESKSLIGDAFTGNTSQQQFEVRILTSDFEKAEKLLENSVRDSIKDVDPDYYLFSFTDEELYEILLKPDEWNTFDCSLSKEILKQRGKVVDESLLQALKNERNIQLAKPEENQKAWIFVGYILSLIGGILGIIIGYVIWKSKKTLPNGEQVHSYNEKDRENGMYIFVLGVIIFPLVVILRVLQEIL